MGLPTLLTDGYFSLRANRMRESYALDYEIRLKAGHIAKKRQYRRYGMPDRDTDFETPTPADTCDSANAFDTGIEALYYFYDQFDRALEKLWFLYIQTYIYDVLIIDGRVAEPEDFVCLRTLQK